MPTIKQFLLPDPAEGLTEAEIVTWLVAVGDTVELNQNLVEIETAKSLVELPSPFAGVVTEIHVPAGQVALVGSPIVSIDVDPDSADPTPPPDAEPPARQPVLVGYGPKETTPTRRPRRAWPHAFGPGSGVAQSAATVLQQAFSADRPVATPVAPPRPPRPVTPVPHEPVGDRRLPSAGEPARPSLPPDVRKLAKPPVRKLARDLGIDLADVDGTGTHGLVTRADVQAAAERLQQVEAAGPREERIAISGVRKLTAAAMVSSAFTAPHVTVWVSVNVTASLELIARLRGRPEFSAAPLTPLVLVAKALCLAVSRNPGINASWDEPAGEIVVKHYVNLGFAVATPRGLLVPNVTDAHAKSLPQLAVELAEAAGQARDGHLPPARMQGGTITITNVGVFGVDGGTPLINPPEAAILAMGQIRDRPWVVNGQVVAAKVMQLSLSFDHRLVDGELGSKVLADVAAILEDPSLALAW